MPALQGGALFNAQSLVFGRCLVAREGYDVIGALVDAQIIGKSVDDALAKRNTLDVARMDFDWRRRVLDRAVVLAR